MKLPDFPNYTDIILKYGDPFIVKGKTYAINCAFFAALFLKENDVEHYNAEGNDGDGWYFWNGSRWIPISEKTIRDIIDEMLLDVMARQDILLQHEIDRAQQRIYQIIRSKREKGSIPPLDPDVIPMRNGILQWDKVSQEFRLRDYTREDRIFMTMNVDFKKNAKSEFFERILNEILPSAEDQRVAQEYLGACLFSENRTRKFAIFQGEGGCGKSVLVNILSHILGQDRVFPLNIQAIQHPYELCSLSQQTLFTVSEAVATVFSNAACAEFIKMVVGDDTFQTNLKFKNCKEKHVGRYGVIIMSNHNFRFAYEGRGDEYRDRMLLFRFEHHFTEENRDLTLTDKMSEEDWSAVLNWLLEGARRVRRNNWRITLSPEQISRRDRLIFASKGIDLFVRNHVELSAGRSFTTAEAYSAYSRLQQQENFEYLEETVFAKRLSRAMTAEYSAAPCNTLKGGKVRGYIGFKLA